MSNRPIKIIVGVVLTLSVGFLVFATKKQAFIPNETNSTETVVNEIKQAFATRNFSDENKFYGDENDDDDDDDNRNIIVAAKSIVNNSAQQEITLSQITQNNSRASCWSVINGTVYDLTSWIPNHPGGEKNILSVCGSDGSSSYNSQHGGKSKITVILAGFKIGTLAKYRLLGQSPAILDL